MVERMTALALLTVFWAVQLVTAQACTNGDIRLVNGSSENEGRVEVCVAGHWGTVCNNDQSLAGTACDRAGFPALGAQAVARFGQGFVSRTYDCTAQNGNCSLITDALCENNDLEVVCLTFEEAYNQLRAQCVIPSTTSTTEGQNSSGRIQRISQGQVTVALGAVVGLLSAVIIAMTIGWICTCVVMKKRKTVVMKNSSYENAYKKPDDTQQRNVQNQLYGDTLTSHLDKPKSHHTPTPPQPMYEDPNTLGGRENDRHGEQTYTITDGPGQDYSVVESRKAAVTSQEGYNVLVRNDGRHMNQLPVDFPQEEYSHLELDN